MQLETLMLFGLGFAVAALIALFVTRALWLYALRLGRLRSLRQAPSTHADLKTEINRLRADNAMTVVRLERRAEALATRNAELIARTTRDSERIEVLASEVERQRSRPKPERTAQGVRGMVAPLEAELVERERIIEDLREAVAAREEEIAALRESADRYARDIADRDRMIADLRHDAKVAPAGSEMSAPAQARGERLRMRIDELAELSRQIERQREALKAERTQIALLKETGPEADLEPLARAGAAIEAQLVDAEREVESIERDIDAVAPAPAVAPEGASEPGTAAAKTKDRASRPLRPVAKPANLTALANRLRTLQRDNSS